MLLGSTRSLCPRIGPPIALLLAFMAACAADELIPEHGRYSQTYQSDWAALPTGKDLAKWDIALQSFRAVNGEQVRAVFRNQAEVRLSGERLKVRWSKPGCDKYRHALYLFTHCEKVVIEDMAILNADPDFRASSTFFFEDCGRVEIRNCYIAGTCGRAMIRIEGCREYFIDRVDLSGWDYPDAGMKAGPGIFINNGAGWDAARDRPGAIYAANFRELEWGVIQNSYIHDHPNTEPDTNHDGILLHAPADGLIFNCVFENYEGDSCLDVSHRRSDPGYRRHHFRVERNVFDRCHRVKTNGAVGSGDCSILWCNNLYLDSMLTDYHAGWPNWHVHETFINHTGGGYFLTMYCRDGPTLLRNCLIHCPVSPGSMYEPWGKADEQDTWIQPDRCIYSMPAPRSWLKPRGEHGRVITTWEDWRAAGFDTHSLLTQAEPGFRDPAAGDYRLLPTSPATGAGTPHMQQAAELRRAVKSDFYGRPRPDPPSMGAFEASP